MPKSKRKPWPNVAEEQCALEMEAQGFEVTKRGWPDFIAIRQGSSGQREIVFVEVRPCGTRKLKRSQRDVMSILKRAGLACFRWDPDNKLQTFSIEADKEIAKAARIANPRPAWLPSKAERKLAKRREHEARRRERWRLKSQEATEPLAAPLWRLASG